MVNINHKKLFAAILKSASKQRVEEKDNLLTHTSYVLVLSFVNKIKKTSKPTDRLDCVCLYVLLFNFCLVFVLGIIFWSAAHVLPFFVSFYYSHQGN